jgi:hypothetical protein
MTYCMSDSAPESWFRTDFPNTYLGAVCERLDSLDINYELSGAVTCGVMEALYGPNKTTVAFENEIDRDAFVKWFTETNPKETSGIFVPVAAISKQSGTRITEFPKE